MPLKPQLYSEWEAEALAQPDLPWLVEDFLPANSLTLIAGRPKLSAKSWTAYAMAFATASGSTVGPFKPTGSYPVLYIDLEGNAKEAAKRRSLLNGGGFSISNMEGLPMWEAHGQYFLLTFKEEVTALIEFIREHGIKAVFIDTFAKAASGMDENSAQHMGRVLLAVDRIKRENCAVVLVHHLRKAYRQEPDTVLDATAGLRGSGALEGGFDHILSITSARVDDHEQYFWVTGGKFAPWEAYAIEWRFAKDAYARLNWEKLSDVPHVDPQAKKAKQ